MQNLIAEYTRLVDERRSLTLHGRTRESAEKLTKVTARLVEILSTPPDGYTTPATARQLVEHAEAHGWHAMALWTPPDYEGRPFLEAQVQHADWRYQLTWHSRDCKPGRVRLFSSRAQTPDRPGWHDAPSVKAIRAVIDTHPARGAAA